MRTMIGFHRWFACCVTALVLIGSATLAQAGPMRITMTDGSSIQVPFFWELGDEIRFEIPGGQIGIPKSDVASVQEIVSAREYDPEVLLEPPQQSPVPSQDRALREFVEGKIPPSSQYHKVEGKEGLDLLSLAEKNKAGAPGQQAGRLRSPLFTVEADYAQLLRSDGGGTMLLIRNVVSSRQELKGRAFTLNVYDGEGNIMSRVPCEIREITADHKTLRDLAIKGRIYSVEAMLKPDPNIKHYEIVTASR